MKFQMTKPLALILCGTLLVGASAGAAAAYAAGSNRSAENLSKSETSLMAQEPEADLQKDETVYVLAGAEGSVKKIIVSDWIKNAVGSTSIADKSELTNVENVKGNETYTMNGDTMRVWDAQGHDIYYQGNIEKELPVTLKVSYQLNGQSISAEDLAGKSGRVAVRFDYQNNQYQTVKIDGKEEKIYVPFVMLTGMMLDNDVFKNVEVTNGKIINDGSRTMVAGLAFPGLQSNLNVSTDKFEIPDYVEITADVTGFEMTSTVTVATNEIFSKINSEKISTEKLDEALSKLTDAMKQLTDGSSQLYNGLVTLLKKSDELVAGIDKLADGARQLKEGTGSLKNGAAQVGAGSKELADGLSELTANNATLNGGAKQVFEALLKTANEQIAATGLQVPTLTMENYDTVLDGILASLKPEQVKKTAQEQVTKQVTATVLKSVRNGVYQTMFQMTVEQYEAAVKEGKIQQAYQEAAAKQIEAIMQKKETQQTIQQNVLDYVRSEEGQTKLAAALKEAEEGTKKLTALKTQLDSYNTFYEGLQQYTAGVAKAGNGAASLSTGAEALSKGAQNLDSGMATLYDGILTMKQGTPALVSGVSQLKDGAMKLSKGLAEFDEKGISKLTEVLNGDVSGLVTRLKATVDVSKDYKSFSGLSDEMDGQVKFIYRTDSVESKK